MSLDLVALEAELQLELQKYETVLMSNTFHSTIDSNTTPQSPLGAHSNVSLSPLYTPITPQITGNMGSARNISVTNSGSIYYPVASSLAGNKNVDINHEPDVSANERNKERYLNRISFDIAAEEAEEEILQDHLHVLRMETSAAQSESQNFKTNLAEHDAQFAILMSNQRDLREENAELRIKLEEVIAKLSLASFPGGDAFIDVATVDGGRRRKLSQEEFQMPHSNEQELPLSGTENEDLDVLNEAQRLNFETLEAKVAAVAARDASTRKAFTENSQREVERFRKMAEHWKQVAEQEYHRAVIATQQRDAYKSAYEAIKSHICK